MDKKSRFVKSKKEIQWPAVIAEIKKKSGTEHTANYLGNVFYGRQRSTHLRELLFNILGDPEQYKPGETK